MKILSSSWVVMLLGGLLYLGTTSAVLLANKSSFKPPPHLASVTNRPPANVRGPSWEFFNPDLEDMVKELKERQDGLDNREKELDLYAARLKSEKEEISQITRHIEEMRKNLDDNIITIRQDEQSNLKKLAKNYSQMDPAAAAQVMSGLDDITLVKVLMFMKDAQSAPILTQIAGKGAAAAKRMAQVSERLRLTQQAKPTTP
jgi:flagellar motility protein MotE (MotC chaperone)